MYTNVSRGMQANAVSVQGLSIMTMTFAKGTLFHLVHRASHLLLDVVKVVSHMDISQVEGEVDRWVVRGNATADRLASEVFLQVPAHAQKALDNAFAAWCLRKEVCEHLQKFVVAMGHRALSAKEEIREGDVERWEDAGERSVATSSAV